MLTTLRNPNSKACNTYNEKNEKTKGFFFFQNIQNEDLKITKSISVFLNYFSRSIFIKDL
jgi:hypothetical protein